MVKRQLELVLSRARYAAIGAAVGGGLGGLFSRSAASSGAAIGALVGSAIGESRLTAQTRLDELREQRGELFSSNEAE